jgi:Asp-tRNA(Asn)/Glu-tRNA(Gln) amidotransferase B subunit
MPEPNLPPLNLEAIGIDVEGVRNRLPELPNDTRQRLIQKFGLKPVVAVAIVDQPYLVQFFDEVRPIVH